MRESRTEKQSMKIERAGRKDFASIVVASVTTSMMEWTLTTLEPFECLVLLVFSINRAMRSCSRYTAEVVRELMAAWSSVGLDHQSFLEAAKQLHAALHDNA